MTPCSWCAAGDERDSGDVVLVGLVEQNSGPGFPVYACHEHRVEHDFVPLRTTTSPTW
ncbi:hypothetical protein [Streptomyces bohaiensis]|uniref:hypothetical protein n=1 Tax=Streptomyces bohaiensis TaxID=1431344 RepID=UPI003B77B83D